MNIFAQASRRRLRFESVKGSLGVEDLWDLPLTSKRADGADLDTIALDLDSKLGTETKSFVRDRTTANEELQLKFDIVKFVIDTKVREAREEAESKVRSERKKKLLDALEKKTDSALEAMSVEDIKKELAEL